MKLTTVLENSLKEMGLADGKIASLSESTDVSDIAQFIGNVEGLIKEKFKTSLAYEICDVQQLNSPVGKIFVLTKEDETNGKWKFVVKQKTVEVSSKKVNSGFTLEAWQDLNAIYGEDANEVCANILAKVSGSTETTDLIDLIKAQATDMSTLNAESYEHIFTKIGEAISKINQKTFRSMDAFVIIPAEFAGNLITDPNYFVSDSLETKSQFLQYKFGRTKYYVNPDSTDTNVYIGVNGQEPGTSSIIFSPYQYTVASAQDTDSGATYVYVFNRYAISTSPLHTVNNPMIYKFNLVMPFTI